MHQKIKLSVENARNRVIGCGQVGLLFLPLGEEVLMPQDKLQWAMHVSECQWFTKHIIAETFNHYCTDVILQT